MDYSQLANIFELCNLCFLPMHGKAERHWSQLWKLGSLCRHCFHANFPGSEAWQINMGRMDDIFHLIPLHHDGFCQAHFHYWNGADKNAAQESGDGDVRAMRLKLTLSFLSMNCLATTAASCRPSTQLHLLAKTSLILSFSVF